METLATVQPDPNAVAGGFLGGMLAFYLITIFIILILVIIAEWKIFTKAGEKGWKSLIPIYNLVVAFRIVGMSPWWVLVMFVFSIIPCFTGNYDPNGNIIFTANFFGNFVVVLFTLFALFIDIYYAIRLAKAFKKGPGFTVGLILLPVIFYLILGFGHSKYDKKAALKA